MEQGCPVIHLLMKNPYYHHICYMSHITYVYSFHIMQRKAFANRMFVRYISFLCKVFANCYVGYTLRRNTTPGF